VGNAVEVGVVFSEVYYKAIWSHCQPSYNRDWSFVRVRESCADADIVPESAGTEKGGFDLGKALAEGRN